MFTDESDQNGNHEGYIRYQEPIELENGASRENNIYLSAASVFFFSFNNFRVLI